MYKTVIRAAPRRVLSSQSTLNSSRRFLSTASPTKSRSWKSSALRWGLAAGGVYYYNTSNVFAEQPDAAIQKLDESLHRLQESKEPTIDAIMEEKRLRQAQQAAENEKSLQTAEGAIDDQEDGEGGDMEGLEEEADSQGAFNPETGEINWDCPCLGGMADGPCGPEFKAAFSCFVYSTEEPKGVECIDKFKGMQDCFRQHPEMYGAELEGDEDDVEEELHAREAAAEAAKQAPESTAEASAKSIPELTTEPKEETKPAPLAVEQKASISDKKSQPEKDANDIKKIPLDDELDELVPKKAHDATSN